MEWEGVLDGQKDCRQRTIRCAGRDKQRQGSTSKTDQASIHESSLYQAVERESILTGWFSLLCLLETGGNECLQFTKSRCIQSLEIDLNLLRIEVSQSLSGLQSTTFILFHMNIPVNPLSIRVFIM